VKDFYNKNDKTQFKDDTERWESLPCLWMRRTDIAKMSILLIATYRPNQSPSKYQYHSLQNYKIILKSYESTEDAE
jgi:hypothetical protein